VTVSADVDSGLILSLPIAYGWGGNNATPNEYSSTDRHRKDVGRQQQGTAGNG
jgi:hypothetical protein